METGPVVKSTKGGDVTHPSEETGGFGEDDLLKAKAEVYKNKGNDEYQKKDFNKAVHFYTEGLKLGCKDDELNAKLYNNRATVNFYMGNYQQSLKDAKAAVKLQPNYIKAIERGARACMELGLHLEAVGWCETGLAIDKNNKALLDLRRRTADEQTKELDKNMESRRESQIVKDQTSPNVRPCEDVEDQCSEIHVSLNAGDDCYKAGDFKRAIQHYEKYLISTKYMDDKSTKGRVYNNLGNAYQIVGNLERALECHDSCLKIAKEEGDKMGEGRAYGNLGSALYSLGDFTRSIDYQERCVAIAQQLGNRIGEARAYGNLGSTFYSLRNFEKAIDCHRRCLKISEEEGDRIGEEYTYSNLAMAYSSLGDLEKAIEYHERCLAFVRRGVDRSKEAIVNGNLGITYSRLGNFKTAIECQKQCLTIAKELEDKFEEGRAYGNLGSAYYRLGKFQTAIDYHERSLEIAEQIKDKTEEGKQCCNLGNDYISRGDHKKAIYYHERYLRTAKEVGNKFEEGCAYGNIGNSYHNQGDFKQAIDCHKRCLKIAKEVKSRPEEGRACINLGNAFCSLGDFKKAIDCLERGVKIAEEIGDKAELGRACDNLGRAHKSIGNFNKAIAHHERYLEIAKDLEDKSEVGRTYGSLGSDYIAVKRLKKGVDCFKRCLKIAKEVKDRSEEGRANGNLGNAYYSLRDFETAKEYYENCLKIVQEVGRRAEEGIAYCNLGNAYHSLKNYEKSVEYLELGLKIANEVGDAATEAAANSSLGSTFEAQGSLNKAVDCYQSGVRISNDVRARLQLKDEWKIRLRHGNQDSYTGLWRTLLKLERPLEALCAAERGRAQALKDLLESKYGIQTAGKRPGLEEEAMEDMFKGIPCSTIFLAHDNAQGMIHFWVIQSDGTVCSRSKQVSDFNTQDDESRCSESLVKSTFKGIGARCAMNCEDRSFGKPAEPSSAEERSDQTPSSSLHPQIEHLRRLYDVIIEPVKDLIQSDEVIIVPEGPLWLVPFAALTDANSKYLYEFFRIRVVPSLTSLKLIMDCHADFHRRTGVLLVGDPTVQEITSIKLKQLSYARKEVEMIGQILNARPLIGDEATKEEVLKRLAWTHGLVHIAAHGAAETGEIALCPNPSRASQEIKDEDFLLTMADVLKVKLEAQLVVLSCCHSGRGEINAEGAVGVARAFLGAGARSVLVALWAIDDEATLQFMRNFYQHLMDGRSASESLNLSMKSMRESNAFSEVKYWAPFVLIGDDVKL